ncbi:hypothetical protein ACOMHN_061051 [Nucella lapillus]
MDTVDMIADVLLTEMDTVDMIMGQGSGIEGMITDVMLTEMDTVDMILGQWSGSTKTRGQVIRQLKNLRLITSVKDLRKKNVPTQAWTADDEEELKDAFRRYKDANDPVGSILESLSKKRSKNKVIEKLLALDLVTDRKQLHKKRRRRRASDNDEQHHSDSDDDRNSEREGGSDVEELQEGNLPSDEEILSSPTASDGSSNEDSDEEDEAREAYHQAEDERSSSPSSSSSDAVKMLKNVIEKGYKEQVCWIHRVIAQNAKTRESHEVEVSVPIVPLTEDNETAMEDPVFTDFLLRLGLSQPATEQEMFWRIPATLTSAQLHKVAEGIELDEDGELVNQETLIHLQPPKPKPSTSKKTEKKKQADKTDKKKKTLKRREKKEKRKHKRPEKKERRKRRKAGVVQTVNRDDRSDESDDNDDGRRKDGDRNGDDGEDESGQRDKASSASQRREALKAMLERRKGKKVLNRQRKRPRERGGDDQPTEESHEDPSVEETPATRSVGEEVPPPSSPPSSVRARKRVRQTVQSDSDSSHRASSPAKQASGKKQRREQTFRPEYTQRAPCIRPFPQNAKRAWCDYCQVDFKVSHGGWNDVQNHLETAGHERKSAAKNNTSALSAFGFTPEKEMTDKELQVIKAETLFSHFLVEHNLPISASDHAGPLFRAMFPKSEIAQRYGCARTKTTSLLQTCSSTHQDALAEQMKNGPFIIGTDGSQEGTEKFYPIVVRTLTPAGTITTELLANPTCDESATGENIFGLLNRCLGRYDIPWKNCVALMCDNANVMTGRNKGIISYVLRKNSEVHLAGCVCHLLHISLKKGMKASSKFDIDDILRQLHWYITKSTNRHQRLKAHQEACGVPAHAIVAHVPTRWLTMGPALLRILEQWEPLYKFLEEEYRKKNEKGEHTQDAVVTRLRDFFRRRTPKLYVYFYASVIEIFEDTNMHLQSDSARLHTVKRDIDQLFRKLVSGVAKPAAMNQGHIMNIDIIAAYNIKKPEGLFIGRGARDHIEAGVDTAEKEAFFKNVVTFYRTACSYITKNLDTRKAVLWSHGEVSDPFKTKTKEFDDVAYFFRRFPCLLPEGPDAEECWQLLATLKDHKGCLRFRNLARVMLGILLIPVSSASCERVFFIVTKTRTDFRPNLSSKTLESLLVVKTKTQC